MAEKFISTEQTRPILSGGKQKEKIAKNTAQYLDDFHKKIGGDYQKNIVTGTTKTNNKNSRLNLHDDRGNTVGSVGSEKKFRVLGRESQNNRIKILIDGKEAWVDESFVKIDEKIQKTEQSILRKLFSRTGKNREIKQEIEIPKAKPINLPNADGSVKLSNGKTIYPGGRTDLANGVTFFPGDNAMAVKPTPKQNGSPVAGDAIGFMSAGAPIEVRIRGK